MPKIKGTYQGIPILDGEFSLRAGVEPSRGWVRVLLRDLPGKQLPQAGSIRGMVEIFNRDPVRKKDEPRMPIAWSPENPRGTTTIRTGPRPKQGLGLKSPWGELVMETNSEFGKPASKVVLSNIFWIEATVEDAAPIVPRVLVAGKELYEAVVRIELADERILWELGGYVVHDRNLLVNETKSISGELLSLDAATENPTKLSREMPQEKQREHNRPFLDPRTVIDGPKKGKTPRLWSSFELIQEAWQNLPGPPEMLHVTQGIFKSALFDVRWGSGTLAKDALSDLFTRLNLVLVPEYGGAFSIYEKGEEAFPASSWIRTPDEVKPVFWAFPNGFQESSSLVFEPLAVEVIGKRIVEEIMCPHWEMVIKGDGSFEDPLLGRQGKWYLLRDVLSSWGYSFEEAAKSVLANYDMQDSAAWDEMTVDPDDVDDENISNPERAARELKRKRKALLKRHFLRSFMVAGPFREFLPIRTRRAEPLSHALNIPNLEVARDAMFFTDGWNPAKVRSIGVEALFVSSHLEPVDLRALDIDEEAGVITFKDYPRGVPFFNTSFSFLSAAGIEGTIIAESQDFRRHAEEFAAEIQGVFDTIVYDPSNRRYSDIMGVVRERFINFLNDRLKANYEPARKIQYTKTLSQLFGTINTDPRKFMDAVFLHQSETGRLAQERINLSEMILLPPKIVGIWGWERNTGRADDWYRYRRGIHYGAPARPLPMEQFQMYITIHGETNKEALDRIADMKIKEYMESFDKPRRGETWEFAGFHSVALSGTVPEVVWKMSLQTADATTEVVRNRFQHGIAGRPPAVVTWSAFQKPVLRGPSNSYSDIK